MRLPRYLCILVISVLFGAAVPARAQEATVASGFGPSGIRLGDTMLLHLSLGVEFDYDSNVFFQPRGQELGAFFLRLNPAFQLTNGPRSGQRAILFDLHGGLGYVEYLSNRALTAAHRQFNVDAGVAASFFTMSPYNFTIFDNYVRTTQPPYVATNEDFNRDTNEVGTRINMSPGGGRLTFSVGYLFGIDYFENAKLRDYDSQLHIIDVRASWKFLPKTAVYIDAREAIYLYTHPNPTNPHPDSYGLHVVAGIRGLITTKLTVDAWVGYANGFYQWSAAVVTTPHANPNSVTGGLTLSWKPTMLSTGSIGYVHDFQNSTLGAYYDQDMVWVSWTQLVWRFTGFLRFQYANLRFKGVQPIQATTDGTDNYITLNVRVDYPFKNWLVASVGNDLFFNKSDRQLTAGVTPAAVVPVDYVKDVVYLRLTFQY